MVLDFISLDRTPLYVVAGLGVGICIGWLLRGRVRPPSVRHEISTLESVMSEDADLKLMLVVRADLHMGKGKMAAQCAHAAVMAQEQCQETHPELLEAWKNQGQAKVVTRCNSQEELQSLARKARSFGLSTSIVRDAGRTQIAAGSMTVLAVGPGPISLLDEVTGHLKLL